MLNCSCVLNSENIKHPTTEKNIICKILKNERWCGFVCRPTLVPLPSQKEWWVSQGSALALHFPFYHRLPYLGVGHHYDSIHKVFIFVGIRLIILWGNNNGSIRELNYSYDQCTYGSNMTPYIILIIWSATSKFGIMKRCLHFTSSIA